MKLNNQRWSQLLKGIMQQGFHFIIQHPKVLLISVWIITLLAAITMIPMIVVNYQPKQIGMQLKSDIRLDGAVQIDRVADISLNVAVYLTDEKRIIEVPLEQYIRGVLAAEMPIEFELEALKAQAIAARTYIIKRYFEKDFSNVPVQGAWVTDSIVHQVYLTEEEIEKKWSKKPERAENIKKLNQAVEETKGLIITYSGYPILASFFSTSNGYTENSEDYWTSSLPYLRSVVSPWEEALSPKFKTTKIFSKDEVVSKLDIKAVPTSVKLPMKVLERSAGNRIKRIQVGSKVLSGREVREQLGLGSTQFTWRSIGDTIEFTIYGNGHGVGMSQWGAQGMAIDGKKAQDIIAYYYRGVSIEKIHSLESIL